MNEPTTIVLPIQGPYGAIIPIAIHDWTPSAHQVTFLVGGWGNSPADFQEILDPIRQVARPNQPYALIPIDLTQADGTITTVRPLSEQAMIIAKAIKATWSALPQLTDVVLITMSMGGIAALNAFDVLIQWEGNSSSLPSPLKVVLLSAPLFDEFGRDFLEQRAGKVYHGEKGVQENGFNHKTPPLLYLFPRSRGGITAMSPGAIDELATIMPSEYWARLKQTGTPVLVINSAADTIIDTTKIDGNIKWVNIPGGHGFTGHINEVGVAVKTFLD